MEYKVVRFITEPVEVAFDEPPAVEKKPDCPQSFTWQARRYQVIEVLAEWTDFQRRGRMRSNMRPEHALAAAQRGSWGVGQYGFRIRTDQGAIFHLVYDRAPRNAGDRKGHWYLDSEVVLLPD